MSNYPAGVKSTDDYFNGSNSFHWKNGHTFTQPVIYFDEHGEEQFENVTYQLYQGDVTIVDCADYLSFDDKICIIDSIKEMNDDYFKAYKAL